MPPPFDRIGAVTLISIATVLSAGCDSVLDPELAALKVPPDRIVEPVEMPAQAVVVLDDVSTRLLPPFDASGFEPLGPDAGLRARAQQLRAALTRLEAEPGTADPADLDAMRLALAYLDSLESPLP
jgi:hypothetical protein